MPPAGRRPSDNPRRNAIHTRLTDAELATVTTAAEKAAKSVSDYVRDAAVAKAKRAK